MQICKADHISSCDICESGLNKFNSRLLINTTDVHLSNTGPIEDILCLIAIILLVLFRYFQNITENGKSKILQLNEEAVKVETERDILKLLVLSLTKEITVILITF